MERFLTATKALIDLGEGERAHVPELLENKDEAWQLLMCGNDPWTKLARRLSERELANLIRGLILYGNAPGRSTGGSVSPVITLYYVFAERFPDSEPCCVPQLDETLWDL